MPVEQAIGGVLTFSGGVAMVAHTMSDLGGSLYFNGGLIAGDANWGLILDDLVWVGVYDPTSTYAQGHTVLHSGSKMSSYSAVGDVPVGETPANSTYWERVVMGQWTKAGVTHNRGFSIEDDLVHDHTYEVAVVARKVTGEEESTESAARAQLMVVGKTGSSTAPTGLAAVSSFQNIFLTWTASTDVDWDYVEIWRADTNNRAGAAQIALVRGTAFTDTIGVTGVTKYYWIRGKDTSGNASGWEPLGATAGVNATTGEIVATDIDDFAITATKIFTRIPIITGDAWTDNSPIAGTVAWNAHTLTYDGNAFAISGGNTASKYVYWEIASPTVYQSSNTNPTLADTGFVIATNVGGYHDLAWNAIANEVIGSAYIEDLAVSNAKIANLAVDDAKVASLNADKITTGRIQSADGNTYFDLDNSTLVIGSASGYGNISDKPTELADVNSTEGSKLAGIEAGATAGATWGTNVASIPARLAEDDSPETTGVFITPNYIGFYDSVAAAWPMRIKNNSGAGEFYFGDGTKFVSYASGVLTSQGKTQTAGGTGKRMVLDDSDNTLRFYNSSNVNVVTIDDDANGLVRVKGTISAYTDSTNFAGIFGDGHIWLRGSPTYSLQITQQSTGTGISLSAPNVTNAALSVYGYSGASTETIRIDASGDIVSRGKLILYDGFSGTHSVAIKCTGGSELTVTATINGIELATHNHDGATGGATVDYGDLTGTPTLGEAATLDVGTGSWDVAAGDHNHSGVYEPANANIQSHISSTSNPHSVTYSQTGAAASGHNHSGVYQPHSATLDDVQSDGNDYTAVWGQISVGAGYTTPGWVSLDGMYEPANANIQSHISSTSNPHSVTYSQTGAAASGHNHSGVYQPASTLLDDVQSNSIDDESYVWGQATSGAEGQTEPQWVSIGVALSAYGGVNCFFYDAGGHEFTVTNGIITAVD